jgi:hypothetical protein
MSRRSAIFADLSPRLADLVPDIAAGYRYCVVVRVVW